MIFFFVILNVYSQTTYYVTSNGSDSSTCGIKNVPCATINQILINYPGLSYTVSIGTGEYTPTKITLQRDAVVIFQGMDNPIVTPLWSSGLLIVNTISSGFEFHDISITLSGAGDAFTTTNGVENVVGFYNVILTYIDFSSGAFVIIYGGFVVISDVTVVDANFNGEFMIDISENCDDTSVIVTGSTFSNLTIGKDGGFLFFKGCGNTSVIVNDSTFTGINSFGGLIRFYSQYSNQVVSVTNSVFNNSYTFTPPICIQNHFQSVTMVGNTTWNNSTSDELSGGLYIFGIDDGDDYNVTLINLKFNDCSGPYAGAIYIVYLSLNISNSYFSAGNGLYGSDVVQDVPIDSGYWYNITNCYSTSRLPKAVVMDSLFGTVVDISEEFPNPSTGT